MTALIIPAAQASPSEALDVFAAAFGRPRIQRNRTAEAEYIAALNAHFRAAKAASDAIKAAGPRKGEDRLSLLVRALAPIFADQKWAREQARAWAAGTWVVVEGERKAA